MSTPTAPLSPSPEYHNMSTPQNTWLGSDDKVQSSQASPDLGGKYDKKLSPSNGGVDDTNKGNGEEYPDLRVEPVNEDRNLNYSAEHAKTVRTVTWLQCVWLICTDLLGPGQAPLGIATLGYIGGAIIYIVMGAIFCYSSMLLLKLYLFYHNDEHPIRTYGELCERVMGLWGPKWGVTGRWVVIIGQILQLNLNVAVAILGSAQAMFQVSGNNFCFIALAAIHTGAGTLLACVRNLGNLSLLSSLAMAANIFICFATLGVTATTPAFTNFDSAAPSSLLQAGFVPVDANGNGVFPVGGVLFSDFPLEARMNGISTCIYAYSGATIFVEFMAEMKRPADFKKAFAIGATVVISLYLGFGLGEYAIQGPYVANPANQGISTFGWQTALNIITIVTLWISGVMYGNVGMKVAYHNILYDQFGAPALDTRKGHGWWCCLALCYWWLAFTLAEVIPQFSAFSGIVSAVCMMAFSFYIPQILHVVHLSQQTPVRKAWISWDLSIVLCSQVLVGMVLWGSIEVLLSALQDGSTAIFSCTGP